MNEIIEKSIKLIENNLHEKINIEDLAFELGYSKHYFSKLFKKNTGLTVLTYITNRKLICASKDIISGHRIIDVSMTYGYDTQTGFSKAFVKKFGFPPNMLHLMRYLKELFSDNGGPIMNYETMYLELKNQLRKSHTDISQFEKAYELVLESSKDKKRYSGEPYIVHQLSVASLLEKMDMPLDIIVLGLLHEALLANSQINVVILEQHFGQEMVSQIKQLDQLVIKDNNFDNLISETNSNIILIKLADRLHNMKTLKHLSKDRWIEKANETLRLFIPLADSLGQEELKLELEHLSLEYL